MAQQLKARDALLLQLDAVTMAAGTTGATGDHDSTAIDMGAADVDEWGATEMIVDVPTLMTSGGSATINFQILDCDTVGGTYAILTPAPISTGVIDFDDAALLVDAPAIRLPIPRYGVRQFIKLRYTVATTTITGGVVNAWLSARA